LIYWFKTPQKYWLNKNNISPKEIFIHHPDEEYVSNLQKSQLITKIIQQVEIDNHNIIDDLNELNIYDQLAENGIIMPKNSIFTKEKEIKDLLSSLCASLSQHNKINKIYVKLNANKEEYLIADDTVIELINAKLSLSRLIEAWIKLLFISSLKTNIKRTKVIFRTENNYKSQIIQSPGATDSNLILEEYINIFKNYSEKCLPLPPESAYKYVEAKIKSKNAKKAFTDKWIGNKNFSKGERDNIVMKICFGNEKEQDFFLGNNYFDLWKSINHLEAGLNRVEADELTYGLHILVRTELEIDLIEGGLPAEDIPEEWNKRYGELLGIKPSNDSEGWLQDVHWSEGAFGYFPSYLLGHLISAQISSQMERDIGLTDDLIQNGEYQKIIFWLRNNVHKYGRSVNSMELIRMVTKEELSPSYFINHLKSKINDFC